MSLLIGFVFSATPAFAETPAAGATTTTVTTTTVVEPRTGFSIDEEDCNGRLLKKFVTARAYATIVEAEANARATCLSAEGDREIAEAEADLILAEAEAVRGRVNNEFIMVAGASGAASAGGSTCYRSGATEICTGEAATEEARTRGLVAWQQGMSPALYSIGGYDPRLDASVGIAQQSYAGFNASQRATEVWRGQAMTESAARTATEAELESAKAAAAKAKAQAKAAKAETEKVAAERDSLAADLEVSLP